MASEGYEWPNYITIDPDMDEERRAMVEESLGWLETYYGGFKEVLWDLDILLESGQLSQGVTISEGDYTEHDHDGNVVRLDFEPGFYVGTDGAFHTFSLEETILHELVHATQVDEPEVAQNVDDLVARLEDGRAEIYSFLESKGVPDSYSYFSPDTQEEQYGGHYSFIMDYQDREQIIDLPDIIDDPDFIALRDAYMKDKVALQEYLMRDKEDGAMDHTNSLRALLGKPPRIHYHDTNIYFYEIRDLGGELARSIDLLSEGHPVLPDEGVANAPDQARSYPLLSGTIDPTFVSPEQLAADWQLRYNQDSVNIDYAEWADINQARLQFFEGQSIADLSQEDRTRYDDLINGMRGDANSTPVHASGVSGQPLLSKP